MGPIQKHRVRLAVTVGWLFLLFNLERIHEPINIASFVYPLAAGVAIVMLLWPPSGRRMAIVLPAVLVILFLAKWGLAYPIAGANLPVTITEACALGITAWLGALLSGETDQLEQVSRQLARLDLGRQMPDYETAETDIQRELRRARRYERPLSLVTLEAKAGEVRHAGTTSPMQLETRLRQQFINSFVADLLLRDTKSTDVSAFLDGRFVLVLPETERAAADSLVERLKKRCHEKLGVSLEAGVAAFPGDEVTLAGLLERANSRLQEPAGTTENTRPVSSEYVSEDVLSLVCSAGGMSKPE